MLLIVVSANSPEVEILFETKMKSEAELMEDALAGKRDVGLDVSFGIM
jgi:hypothetical protein